MNTLLWIIASTFIISLLSFVGVIALSLKEKLLEKILLFMVSLSAGALMGGAFLHLIPEAIETQGVNLNIFLYVLVGFLLFFLIEKGLHWHHCHKCHYDHKDKDHRGKCVHTFTYMNLCGDAVHNFVDGLIIAASFVVSIPLGFTTSLAIILHEIPQEIGDFGVLLYGGFTKKKALLMNFLVALTAIIGGIVGYFLASFTESIIIFILPFAAGGFIYIAASDLIPEIRKEVSLKKSLVNIIIFVLGIALMYAIKFLG